MLKQVNSCCCTYDTQAKLAKTKCTYTWAYMTYKILNHVMVGELPKLPNDTIQPYMYDKTDVREHT